MVGVINLKEIKKRKKRNTGIDKLFLKKLQKPLENIFSSKLRELYLPVMMASIEDNIVEKNKIIKEIRVLDKQCFNNSDNLSNKIQLLKYYGMLTNKYNLRIVNFIILNLNELLEKSMKEEIKDILQEIVNKDDSNVKIIAEKYISIINEKDNCKLKLGGCIPSYEDINNEGISIGGCIYASFQ